MERAEERKLIDFSDPCLRTFLPVLLQDHTTGKNIIWATDPPPELGVGFADEITLEQLDKVQLVPRVQKRIADQKKAHQQESRGVHADLGLQKDDRRCRKRPERRGLEGMHQ